MDQEIQKEFEDLTEIVRDSFDSVEKRMADLATKEDLQKVETKLDQKIVGLDQKIVGLDQKIVGLDQKIESLWTEVRSLRREIEEVKNKLDRLDKRVTEDTNAFAGDLVFLRDKVKELERRLARVEMARA